MKLIGFLLGPMLLLAAAATAPPGHARIGCFLDNDPRYPRASLLIENNLILPVEISAGWVTPESTLFPMLQSRSVAPRSEQRFLYGISIGRNIVHLKVIVDGNIYEAEQSVFVNNEQDGTCQRTYKVIVTQHTFPRAIIGTEPTGPRPVTARYLGCFADNRSAAPTGVAGRDLDGDVWNHATMTVNACIARCRAGNFAFAGVQYRTWCFCGNEHGRHGASGACNMPCPGNPQETCGGAWANGIYALK